MSHSTHCTYSYTSTTTRYTSLLKPCTITTKIPQRTPLSGIACLLLRILVLAFCPPICRFTPPLVWALLALNFLALQHFSLCHSRRTCIVRGFDLRGACLRGLLTHTCILDVRCTFGDDVGGDGGCVLHYALPGLDVSTHHALQRRCEIPRCWTKQTSQSLKTK